MLVQATSLMLNPVGGHVGKPSPSGSAGAPDIRALAAVDIPAVAALFYKTFRNPRSAVPRSLERYFHELFLQHPSQDPSVPSLVYVGPNGDVRGFIGVLPLQMTFDGRPVRAAIAGSLMVDRPAENPLAGARLMRSFLNGPQEFSFSESANPISQRMWERSGGKSAPAYSMEWLRLLRPASTVVALLGERWRPFKLLRPVALVIDWIADRLAHNPLRVAATSSAHVSDAAASDDEFRACLANLSAGYRLRPDWERNDLPWMLRHASSKERYGTMFRRIVYGRNKTPIGCYLYFGRPGGVAFVLQMLASPGHAGEVVDSLLLHAVENGSVALRGRAEPALLDALLLRKCIFLHRSSTVVHSSNAELLAAVAAGDALITGLAAESWTQIIGGTFG